MPGTDPAATLSTVFDLLGAGDVPFVPELPARGVGADMIGRTASVLVDLPVDLQPSGWRLVDHPGRDQSRADSFWRQDIDLLAERADGYVGPISVAVAGPATLAAQLHRSRGEVALADPGARREITQSLGQGIVELLGTLHRAVPGATWLVQLDEPSLTAVIRGGVPTVSGFGHLPAIEVAEVTANLTHVVDHIRAASPTTSTGVHCCADDAPLRLIASAAPDLVGIALGMGDITDIASDAWQACAEIVESGRRITVGLSDPLRAGSAASPLDSGRADAAAFVTAWRQIGLSPDQLAGVGVTTVCGLAGASPRGAVAALRRVLGTVSALVEAVDER